METLSREEINVLRQLAEGGALKGHRYLDGARRVRIHPLQGEAIDVTPSIVQALQRRRLIDSNMKFPAATYLLTDQGRALTARLFDDAMPALASENFSTT